MILFYLKTVEYFPRSIKKHASNSVQTTLGMSYRLIANGMKMFQRINVMEGVTGNFITLSFINWP